MRTNRIDVHVGIRLRELRIARDLTPEQLAQQAGIDAARLRAHESGTARVDAAHLIALARALDVCVGSFFDGLR